MNIDDLLAEESGDQKLAKKKSKRQRKKANKIAKTESDLIDAPDHNEKSINLVS